MGCTSAAKLAKTRPGKRLVQRLMRQDDLPSGLEEAVFGMGCFWGVERKFWQIGDGVWITAVGYAGGITPNPT